MSDDLSGFRLIEPEPEIGINLTQTIEISEGVSMPPKTEPEEDEFGFTSLEYLKPEEADVEMPDPSMQPDIVTAKQSFLDEDIQAEMDTTAILSDMMDIPLNQANQLQKGMTEHPITKQPLSVKERLAYVKDMWNMGWQDYNMAMLGWQIINNEGDVGGAWKQIESMQAGIDVDRRKEVGLFFQALGGAGRMLPIMLKSMEKGTQLGLAAGAGAAGIAAIAGQVGPQAALPEEIVTVPGAFATMFGVGMTTGSTQHIMKIEAGLACIEMIQEGIDPEIAKWSSIGVGVVNAGIEVLQIEGVLKTIPGIKQILNKSLKRGIANVIKSDVLKNLGRSAMNGVFGVVKEAGQEVAQESVTIVGTEVARELTKLLQEKDVKGKERIALQGRISTQEAVDRLWETFNQSLLSFGVTMLPGTVVSAIAEAGPKVKGPGIVAEKETGIKQPSQDLEEIYKLTEEAKPDIESKTQEIAGVFDSAEVVMRKELKKRERAEQKIETDYEGDVSKISDIQGAFVVVETTEDLKAKIQEVVKDENVVRIKNTYDYPSPVGWRSVLLNLKAPNDAVYEVQITDKDTYRADFEGAGHSFYKVIRQVDAELVEHRDSYTVEQQKEIGKITDELTDISYKYYEKAQAEGFDAAKAFALASETTEALDHISKSLPEVISSNAPLERSLQSLRTDLSNMKASVSPISQVISAIKKPLKRIIGEKKEIVKTGEEKVLEQKAKKYKTAKEFVESISIKSGQEKREAIKNWKKETGYKEVDSSFDRGDGLHSPADPEMGSPLYNLTENGTYPEDVYSVKGLKYYGTGEVAMDRRAYNIISWAEGYPSAQLKIYRAVEKGDPQKILPGDWVTTVRDYAKEHGEGTLKGEYKIVNKLVTAKDLYTSGDSWLEYGYHPQKYIPSAVYRKNKSQLTAIWNKIHKEKAIPSERKPVIGEAEIRQEIRKETIESLLQEVQIGTGKRALGKAYTIGKGVGVKERAALAKEAKEKVKIRKETSTEINKIIRDFKVVSKKLDHMSEGQAQPIRELIEGLDLVRRREKTMRRLEKTREYFENNPEAEIPDRVKKTLSILDKKNLNELTVDELHDIHDAVMHHVHLEKLKQRIRVGKEVRRAEKVLASGIEEMRPPKGILTDEVTSKMSVVDKAKSVGKKIKNFFGLRHFHYDLIVEMIAGKNSTADKILFQGVKDGIREQLRHRQNAFKQFQTDLETEGFKEKDVGKWLDERVKVGRFNLTRNERMEIYNHAQNWDNRESMIEAGIGFKYGPDANQKFTISEEELNQILSSLTKAELAFAGKPVRNLFDAQGQALDNIFKQKNGYSLKLEENYFPKDVMPISRGMDIEKESALEIFKGTWTRIGVKKGMLERRQRVKKPIYIHGLTRAINESVMNASAYVGLEMPLSNASKLLYNPAYKKNMVLSYGKETWNEIDKGLRDIAGEWKNYTDFEEALTKLRARMSTAILGLNPFVMVKQPLSYSGYSVYVKPGYLIRGMADYVAKSKELTERHKLYSPEFLERVEAGFSRDVGEVAQVKGRAAKRLFKGKATMPERMMGGIKWFDQAAVTPGMQGAVLQVLDEFQSGKLSKTVKEALDMKDSNIKRMTAEDKMKAAYRYADYATNRTQPTFAAEHRSSLSRGTPVEKLFTQFSSYTNQAYNMLVRSMMDTTRTKKGTAEHKAAVKRTTAAFVSVMAINTLGNIGVNELRRLAYGRKREDDDKLYARILSSWAGMFYIVRDLTSSVMSKVRRGIFAGYDINLPVGRVANLFGNVMARSFRMLDLTTSKKKRKKEALKFLDESMDLTFSLIGLPYSTPRKLVGRIAKEVTK